MLFAFFEDRNGLLALALTASVPTTSNISFALSPGAPD
jgi:hypothetical protein